MIRRLSIFSIILLLPLLAGLPERATAQTGDASALIAEVNALRASYGLAPYEVDYSLMAAAQAHSEYQVQLGTWTHTGAGGTRPHDRAVVAGYGSGAQVYISENVAMGVDMNSSQVVYQMWQDAIHLDTMISPRYRHIGAGVASNDNYVFYTIDVGYIAGEPGTGDGGSPPGEAGTPGAAGTPGPAEIAMVPIALATPRVDGSIIHVVEWGQFLVNLAEAYEVPLADLLALNGINQDTVIYEGDKLLVKVGVTPVSAAEGTSQPNGSGAGIGTGTPQGPENLKPTETPSTNEKLPTRTLTPGLSLAIARAGTVEIPAQSTPNLAAIIPTVEKEELPSAAQGEGSDYLLIAVLGLAVSGTALVLMGSALKRA